MWCQAPEEDQAAGIGLVVACIDAAQDVSSSAYIYSCRSSDIAMAMVKRVL